MANQYTHHISDDQKEFDEFNTKLDKSIHETDQISSEVGIMRRVLQISADRISASAKIMSDATVTMARNSVQGDPKPLIGNIVTAMTGPFGKMVADAIASSGLVQNMGSSIKNSMSDGLASLKDKLFRRKDNSSDDGGFKSLESITTKMSDVVSSNNKSLDQSIRTNVSNPIKLSNELANEQLKETKLQTKIISSLGAPSNITRNSSDVQKDQIQPTTQLSKKLDGIDYKLKESSEGQRHITNQLVSHIDDVKQSSIVSSTITDKTLNNRITDVKNEIRSGSDDKYSSKILDATSATAAKMDHLIDLEDSLVSKISDVADSLVDPSVKRGSLLKNIASKALDTFLFKGKLTALRKGLYTTDIVKSSNPLVTMVSALQEIYRWQRLYGELSKRQLNELIKLGGGQQQEIVGRRGVFWEWMVKQQAAIMKKLSKVQGQGGIKGKVAQLAKIGLNWGILDKLGLGSEESGDDDENAHVSANLFMDNIINKGKSVSQSARQSDINPLATQEYMNRSGIYDPRNPNAGLESVKSGRRAESSRSHSTLNDPELKKLIDGYNSQIEALKKSISSTGNTPDDDLKNKKIKNISDEAKYSIREYYEKKGMNPDDEDFDQADDSSFHHVSTSSSAQSALTGKDDQGVVDSIISKIEWENRIPFRDPAKRDSVLQKVEDELQKSGLSNKYVAKIGSDNKIQLEQILAKGKIRRVADAAIKGPTSVKTARGENIITSANDTILAVKGDTLTKILEVFKFLKEFMETFDSSQFQVPEKGLMSKIKDIGSGVKSTIMGSTRTVIPVMPGGVLTIVSSRRKIDPIYIISKNIEVMARRTEGLHNLAIDEQKHRIKETKKAFWSSLKEKGKKGASALGGMLQGLLGMNPYTLLTLAILALLAFKFPGAVGKVAKWRAGDPIAHTLKGAVVFGKATKLVKETVGTAAKGVAKAGKYVAAKASGKVANWWAERGAKKAAEAAAKKTALKTAAAAAKKASEAAMKKTAVKKASEASAKKTAETVAKKAIGTTAKTTTETVAKKAAGATVKKTAATATKTVAKKAVTKAAGAAAGKAAAKTVGKSVLKKIPFGVGTIVGAGFAAHQWSKGNKGLAALEMLSGIFSAVPLIGTAASIATDVLIGTLEVAAADAVQSKKDLDEMIKRVDADVAIARENAKKRDESIAKQYDDLKKSKIIDDTKDSKGLINQIKIDSENITKQNLSTIKSREDLAQKANNIHSNITLAEHSSLETAAKGNVPTGTSITKPTSSIKQDSLASLNHIEQIKTKNDVKSATKANEALQSTVADGSKKTSNAIMQSSTKIVNSKTNNSSQVINNPQTDPFYIKASGLDPSFMFA